MNKALSTTSKVWCLVCVASFLLLGVQLRRSVGTNWDVDAALDGAKSAASQASELNRLRSSSEQVLFGDPPADDFIDGVSEVLGTLGLPSSTATNVSREADRASATSGESEGTRRRDMRIELRPISIPDLGRFLRAWSAENSAWKPRQISLRKITGRNADPSDYHASLTYSAEYTNSGANP